MTDTEIKKKGRWARKRAAKKRAEAKKGDSFRKTARLRLQRMFQNGFGTKRATDKQNAVTDNKIYSKATFKTYKSQFKQFSEWLDKYHPEAHSLDDTLQYVDEYLKYLINIERSAYSISTAKAALSKIYGVSSTQFIATPPRYRADIKRSRELAERDKNISSKTEQKLARLTSAIGLRRAEMTKIRSEDLFFKNGIPFLNVTKGTKGGKSRIVEIVGKTDAETKDIVNWIQSKRGRLIPKLSTNYDNHRYRAEYAKRVYSKYARKFNKIPNNDRYIMRKERAGEVFDKSAMKVASKYLGHNRISVIAQSYLYN